MRHGTVKQLQTSIAIGSPRSNPSATKCALKALRDEFFRFSFNDQYEVDITGVDRHALHYPVYSRNLAWTALRMDPTGVPQTWTRTTGTNYSAGYIAWYGLVQLGEYHRNKASRHLDSFLAQLDWLERNATLRNDDALVWEMKYDYAEDDIVLRSPWISAFAQGLAISAVIRGWRITRAPNLLKLLERAARIFDLEVDNGGVRTQIAGDTFYTEVPGGSLPGILDGFLVSLIGLYDLYVETSDPGIERLFKEGLDGLKSLLPFWNYRDKWSWYGSRGYLCPWRYHFWNRSLLDVLGTVTGENTLTRVAEHWKSTCLSPLERAEIYVVFLVTKNKSRIYRRTWLQKSMN